MSGRQSTGTCSLVVATTALLLLTAIQIDQAEGFSPLVVALGVKFITRNGP